MKHKRLWFGLVLVLLIGSLPVSFAQSGVLTYGELAPGYVLEADYPGLGLIPFREPIKHIDGKIAFCLEMFVQSFEGTTYDTSPSHPAFTPQMQRDMELIVYTSWTMSPKRYEDWFVTSLLLWERLGYRWAPTLAATAQPNPAGLQHFNYPARRTEIFALVEQYQRVSTLHDQTIRLKVGESLVLDDTSGVLASLLEQTTPLAHTTFQRHGNQLTITGVSAGVDQYVFDRYQPEAVETTLFWLNADNHQDIATFGISSPNETRFRVIVTEPTGTIELIKHGRNDRPLAEVSFRLSNGEGTTVGEGKTNTEGTLTFENLLYGDYVLTEEQTAPGYVARNEPIPVRLDQPSCQVVVKNEPTILEVIKLNHVETPLSGATLQLLNEQETILDEWVSDGTPKIFYELMPGNYIVREIQPPKDYALAKDILVEVQEISTIQTVRFINELGQGALRLEKLDHETNQPLVGATFTVSREDGTEVLSLTTGEDGVVTFPNLTVGSYRVIESGSPPGYVANPEVKTFDIQADGEVVRMTFLNRRITGRVVVQKRDQTTLLPLADTHLGLYSKEHELLQSMVSDEEGFAVFEDIAFGPYYIREMDAPIGYVRSDELHWFDVTTDGETISLRLLNQPIISRLLIRKLDAQTRKPLPGVTFELFREDTSLGTLMTDENGEINLLLNYGDYRVVESQALPGYELTEPIDVLIRADGEEIERIILNNKIPEELPHTGVGDSSLLITMAFGLLAVGLQMQRSTRKKSLRRETRH